MIAAWLIPLVADCRLNEHLLLYSPSPYLNTRNYYDNCIYTFLKELRIFLRYNLAYKQQYFTIFNSFETYVWNNFVNMYSLLMIITIIPYKPCYKEPLKPNKIFTFLLHFYKQFKAIEWVLLTQLTLFKVSRGLTRLRYC